MVASRDLVEGMSPIVGAPDSDVEGTESDVEGTDADAGASITNVVATRKQGE
jgi:hypothetical protein